MLFFYIYIVVDPFYIVTYYTKWAKTSWTYSNNNVHAAKDRRYVPTQLKTVVCIDNIIDEPVKKKTFKVGIN